MFRMTRAQVALEKMAMIDRDNTHKKSPPLHFKNKEKSRWSAGVCLECGEYFEIITQDHAKSHGYKNADDMAKNGNIDWR